MAYTESNLNYDVIHYGKFDKTTTGIGGLKKRYWSNYIEDEDINSLKATSLVLEYLLDKYDGNKLLALKHFKGANKNLDSVHRVLDLYKRIKDEK